MLDASQALDDVLGCVLSHESSNSHLPWEMILKTIEVYHMTQKLEHSWVKDIFTPDELKEYARFEASWHAKSISEKDQFERNWGKLVDELQNNINTDPCAESSVLLAERTMLHVNSLYGRDFIHLRTKKWEKGFAEGKGLDDIGLTKEVVTWLEKAVDAYWHERLHRILNQIGTVDAAEILHDWNEALFDMYGKDDQRKRELYRIALADDKVSDAAKGWLRSLMS